MNCLMFSVLLYQWFKVSAGKKKKKGERRLKDNKQGCDAAKKKRMFQTTVGVMKEKSKSKKIVKAKDRYI